MTIYEDRSINLFYRIINNQLYYYTCPYNAIYNIDGNKSIYTTRELLTQPSTFTRYKPLTTSLRDKFK